MSLRWPARSAWLHGDHGSVQCLLGAPGLKVPARHVGSGAGRARQDNRKDCRGKKFGDFVDSLSVSCRSGAKFSMPGMMDTVLNIGLNDDTASGND